MRLRRDVLVHDKLTLAITGFPDAGAGAAASPTAAAATSSSSLSSSSSSSAGAGAGAGVGAGAGAAPSFTPASAAAASAAGASLAGRRVHAAISLLLPRSRLVPLSAASLNHLRLGPRKDADANRIEPGALQVGAGCGGGGERASERGSGGVGGRKRGGARARRKGAAGRR